MCLSIHVSETLKEKSSKYKYFSKRNICIYINEIDHLGRNVTAVTEGTLSEEQVWEKRDFGNLGFAKVLLGESLLCSINSDKCPTPPPHTHSSETNRRFAFIGKRYFNFIEISHL